MSIRCYTNLQGKIPSYSLARSSYNTSMWSTVSLTILVVFLGIVVEAVPIDNHSQQSHAADTPARHARRPDYTYTVDVGAHKIFPGTANWNTARRTCGEDGAHLVIINSLTEAEAVVRLLESKNLTKSWVGIHDLYQEGEFVSIHDGPLEWTRFNEWRPGMPDNAYGNDQDCVAIYDDMKLNDAPCTLNYNFVCELPLVQSQVPEARAVLDAVPIDNNSSSDHLPERREIYATVTGIRRSDYIYTVGVGAHKIFTHPTDWNTARRTCGEDGAHLVIINSLAEANTIGQLLKSKNLWYSWVGVHDLYQEGEFVTINDKPLAGTGYNVWWPGRPYNHSGDEDCVMIYFPAVKLNNLPCASVITFVCELSSVQSQVPEAPQP